MLLSAARSRPIATASFYLILHLLPWNLNRTMEPIVSEAIDLFDPVVTMEKRAEKARILVCQPKSILCRLSINSSPCWRGRSALLLPTYLNYPLRIIIKIESSLSKSWSTDWCLMFQGPFGLDSCMLTSCHLVGEWNSHRDASDGYAACLEDGYR
ncbi:hypothetical protein BDV06DRAFT_74277 [Aspergillus oleicola]